MSTDHTLTAKLAALGQVARTCGLSREHADLAEAKYVRVHTSNPMDVRSGLSPALSMSVLESVLNGISAL